MGATDVVERCWCTSAYNSGDFIFIETDSGYRSSRGDPKGSQHFLRPDATDQEQGEAVLDALSKSRFVLPEEDMELYDYKLGQARYQAWIADLMTRYGYKTKRALFKEMKHCLIESCNGVLTIQPMHHEKLEAWSGLDKGESVSLPADSPSPEVGAALRLAFSRCT